ncbi:hypothetical protein CF319_g5338 [Tilletia indica]|nr:hypothetical protein CF319_g5338 [Tilletia indica]
MPLYHFERSEHEMQTCTDDSYSDHHLDQETQEAESEHSPPEPELSNSWIRVTVKDGYGYRKDWVKTEDETLGSCVRDYSKYSGLRQEDFSLANRSVPISSFSPLRKQDILNGDTLMVVINPLHVVPTQRPDFIYRLKTLSPRNKEGLPYDHYNGDPTREDECCLQLFLSSIWPGMPTVVVECRSLKNKRVREVLDCLHEAFLFKRTPLTVTSHPDQLDSALGDLQDGDHALQLRFERYHPTYETPIHITAGVEFHQGPGVEHLLEATLFSLEVEEDSSQEVTRKIGFAMPETSTFRTLLEWAQYEFNLDQNSFFLCHGNHVLLAHEVLNETGFVKGSLYDITLRHGPIPPWLLPKVHIPIPFPQTFHIFFRQNGDRLLRLPANRFQTLREVLSSAKDLDLDRVSVHHDGDRVDLSTRVFKLDLYEGCELDILVSRHGGGGARARQGLFARTQATPADDETASNTPSTTADSEADDPPASHSSEALAFQEDIEGFESLLGQDHGILRGLWTLLPPPSTGNVRLSLVGPRIGTWSIMLGPVTPLRTAITYLERIYGHRFRYLHQGVPLDRLGATPWGADLVDGSLIEVFEEQVGGGPPAPEMTSPRQEQLVDLLGLGHSISKGPFLTPKAPLPNHVQLELEGPDVGRWSITLEYESPLSLAFEYIELVYDRSFKYYHDEVNISYLCCTPSNLNFKNSEKITVLPDDGSTPGTSLHFHTYSFPDYDLPYDTTKRSIPTSNRFNLLRNLPTTDPDLMDNIHFYNRPWSRPALASSSMSWSPQDTSPSKTDSPEEETTVSLPQADGYSLTQAPLSDSRPAHACELRISIKGDTCGPWTAYLPKDGTLLPLTNYIKDFTNMELRFLLNGDRIVPEWPVQDIDLQQDDILEAYTEQVGGGPSQPDLEDAHDEHEDEYDAQGRFSETRPTPSPSLQSASSPATPHHPATRPITTEAPVQARRPNISDLMPKGTNPIVPMFKGKNSKGFIRKYEHLGRLCGATNDDLLDHLAFNVSDYQPDIFSLIETHDAYIKRSWAGVREFILTGFDGPEIELFTEHDLKVFVLQERNLATIEDLNHYNLAFLDISSKLLQRGKIGTQQQLHYFVQGLPLHIRRELENSELRTDDATYEAVLHEVQEYFRPRTFFRQLNLEMQRERAQMNHQAPIRTPSLNLSGPSASMEHGGSSAFVKQLEQLSLTISQAMERAAQPAPRPQSQPYRPPPAMVPTQPLTFSQHAPTTGSNAVPVDARGQRPMTCVYCNDPTHLRRSCPILSDHIQKGWVKILDNRICFSDGSPVQGRYGALHEAVTERQQSGRLPPSTGQHPSSNLVGLTSNYLQFDFSPYEYEDEYEGFISNSMSTDAAKRAHEGQEDTRNARPRLTRTTPPSLVPTPLVRFEEPNPSTSQAAPPSIPQTQRPAFPMPTSLQTPGMTAHSPSTQDPQGNQPTPPASPEDDSEDEEPNGKTLRPPKPFRRLRASKLKRESNPDEVAQSLLSSPVTLPWRVIVGLSKDVTKSILDHLRGEMVPIPTTHHPVPWAEADAATVASHLFHHLTGTSPATTTQELSRQLIHQMNNVALGTPARSWYTHGLPMVPVTIKGRQYLALLDSGSQINVLRMSVREELNLPLRYDGRHVVIGAGQQKTILDGICESTPVALASTTEPLHLWVQQRCGYDLILGMPALAAFGIKIDCINGKATMLTKDNKLVELQVLSPADPANTDELPGAFHSSDPASEANHYAFHMNNYTMKFFGSGAWTNKPLTYHLNAKRKSVEEKIRPLASPPSYFIDQPLRPPVYDRDPYTTPLTPFPPPFTPTDKLTLERMSTLNFGPPGFINTEERNLFLHILKLRELAIAFSASDRRKLNPALADPYKMQTIPHEVWEDATFPYPKSARDQILALIDEQLANGDLEYSDSPYATAHFFIRKPDGSWRMIIDMRSANAVSIRDANIPPYLPDFVDGFVGRVCYSLLDLLSFYDQLLLHASSRRLTAFRSPRGHVQKTGMPQGYTNGPAVSQRIANHVGDKDVPENVVPFIDDYGIKGPRSNYDEEPMPGTTIRRWVYEHAVLVERTLYRLDHAHLVVSGPKMVVITDELDITGVTVSFHGKRADPAKIDKLQAWENPCRSQSSLRGFLGIANFVRPFIPNFAIIDAPLRRLVGKTWRWTKEASEAMDRLKAAAKGNHFLGVLDYTSTDDIVLSVDSSQIAVGFVLWQDRPEPAGRTVILYDSIAMTDTEQRYSQPKLELCGVYKAVRKLRYHLIGARFILEIDAMSLRQMLNRPDISNPAMARWVAHLKQYDFTVRHIPGRLHMIPDGLSRTNFNNATPAEDDPSDHHISASHMLATVPSPDTTSIPATNTTTVSTIPFDADKYQRRFRLIGLWLSTGGTDASLAQISRPERRWVRSQIGSFFLDHGRLFRRNGDGLPQLVIDNPQEQLQALTYAHEHRGHRGRDAMASLLLARVWWETLRGDCLRHARSCSVCQLRSREGEVEAQRFAPIPRLFESFALDIVDLGANTGPRRYLVLARCLLSGWVEGRALPNKLASSVAKFIEDDILSRYGPVVRQILTDNGPENSAETAALLARLGIRHARITPNHPQGNSIVERGHAPVVEGLLKASFDDRARTFTYLPYILWADRITTRRTTGSSPFELVFGYLPLLPIDYDLGTFPMLDWSRVHTTGDLLASRARQLRQRQDDLERAAVLLRYARSRGREYLDSSQAHKIRGPLAPKTMVLVRSIATFLGKSVDRWQGPYFVASQSPTGSYELTELDGTPLSRAYGAERLRRYFPRPRVIEEERSFLDDAHDGAFDGPLAAPPPDSGLVLEQIPADLSSLARPLPLDHDLPSPSQLPPDGDTTLLDEVPLLDDNDHTQLPDATLLEEVLLQDGDDHLPLPDNAISAIGQPTPPHFGSSTTAAAPVSPGSTL